MNRFLKTNLQTWLLSAIFLTPLYAQTVDVSAPGTDPGTTIINVADDLTPPVGAEYNSNPEPSGPTQEISIPQTFAPFGHRPETDKTSEDGSVALRDLNGVIIWIDNLNRAVTIPNSALAKTLYVSNTECIVWQNRFDASFNAQGSNSQVVIHRRDENGAVVSSNPITVAGTLLETTAISPGSYSFTLITSQIGPTVPAAESRERFQSGQDANGNPTFSVRDVDQWDVQIFTLYRITFDAQVQVLSSTVRTVAKGGNLGSARVGASSADGSVFINLSIAGNFFVDQPEGEFFYTVPSGIWVSLLPNVENFVSVPVARATDILEDATLEPMEPVYVTSRRLIYEDSNIGTVIERTRQDNGSAIVAGRYELPTGEQVLPVSSFTKPGLEAYVYTIAGSGSDQTLQMYKVDGGLVNLGDAVELPSPLLLGAPYVRNPKDGSLLIRGEGSSGVLWFRTTTDSNGLPTELLAPVPVPSSNLSRPMYVSSEEAVLWMNAQAAVLPGGVVAPANLRHFHVDESQALIGTSLTDKNENPTLISPIIGRYVASAPPLSPDANEEGWFISTFERTAPRVATMRTYRITRAELADSDGDSLPDWIEDGIASDPLNADDDGDTLSDGLEVYPYTVISGSFTYEQAVADAERRGGWLAVPDTQLKQDVMKSLIGTLPLGSSYWLGAKATTSNPFAYEWQYDESGNKVTTAVTVTNWAPGNPTTAGGANRLAIRSDYLWITLPPSRLNGYIMQFYTSNPRKLDTDGDLLTDVDERANGTNPNKSDTDDDSISDYLEVNGYRWVGAEFVLNLESGFTSNPLRKDSDADGIEDADEARPNPYATNPQQPDTDGDGLTDGEERAADTNPLKADSDGDGFNDFEELNANPPSDPNDASSRPDPGDLIPRNPDMHNQVQLVRQQDDVSIPNAFSPFGNRSDYNRFGDDGSAMILDVNGVLLWQDATGVVRPLPNSEYAIPLVVSGTEAIVWTNAFDPARILPEEQEATLKVAVYRVDPATGQIGTPTEVALEGFDILPTAPITTTTQAYTLITFKHAGTSGSGSKLGTVAYIYRVTFTGNAQLVSQIEIPNTIGLPEALSTTRALGHGSDGSIVFSIDPRAFFNTVTDPNVPVQPILDSNTTTHRRIFWVNGSHPGPADVWKELSAGTRIANYDAQLPARVLSTTANRVIYQTAENRPVKDARRNVVTSALISDQQMPLPTGFASDEQFLRISTQTREGNTRWLYTTSANGTTIKGYRTNNTGLQLAYTAAVPAGVFIDPATTVTKINPSDGSAVLQPDSANLLWIFNNFQLTNQNAVSIPNTLNARAVHVQRNELVVWGNARDTINSIGGMRDVDLRHYEQSNGRLVNPTNGFTNLSPKVDGRYVLDTPPFSPDYDRWFMTTVEKTSPTTALFRIYRLVTYSALDADNDGLPDLQEVTLGTDPASPDTDGDGVPDGEEIYPYALVEGAFTWEQARVDAVQRGGRMAVLSTLPAQNGLKQLLGSVMVNRSWWLGGHDTLAEGSYRWLDENGNKYGQNVDAGFRNWAPFQPNNLSEADGMEINGADLLWAMAPISKNQGYVIEYAATNPLMRDAEKRGDVDADGLTYSEEIAAGTNVFVADTDGDGINDGAELYPFRYVNAGFTWEGARDAAKQEGGRLAVLDSLAKLNGAIRQIGNGFGGLNVWIGLNDINPPVPAGSSAEGAYWWVNANGDNIDPITQTRVGTPLGAFSYWGAGQPNNVNDADGVASGDGFVWRTLPVSTRQGYVVEFPNSNPLNPDSDGDGLMDAAEINSHGTDARLADTDGDGLTDGQEINGVGGYTSNPIVADTDGDLISDFDESRAVPPTNPNDPQSYPSGATPVLSSNHSAPVKWTPDQTITIDQTYAQFGQRPTSVKIGEDGSAALRDNNGVLIWVNRAGQAIVVPNSGLADALFVSNTELVTWDNKYNMPADVVENDTESLVTMHRRSDDGTLTQSPQLTLDGTIVDTPPVTPMTYALNILTYKRWEDGDESIQQVPDGNGGLTAEPVDAWDRMDLNFHTLTWDGQLKKIEIPSPSIPKFTGIGGIPVAPVPIGFGSDGSMVFNFFRANQSTFTATENPVNGRVATVAAWLSNTGMISYLPDRTTVVGHVSNTRLITYSPEFTTPAVTAADGTVTTPEVINPPVVRDIRRSSTVATLTVAQALQTPGEVMLPFNTYTKLGAPVHMYMTDVSSRSIVLYNGDLSVTKRGNAVILPSSAQISSDAAFVRNPVDASLLLKPNNSGTDIFWIRTTVGNSTAQPTLLQPFAVRGTSAALPMFVNNAEAVSWNNGRAAVGALGVIPAASISHMNWDSTRLSAVVRTLTPPIQGRYVVNTPQVVLDPDSEGWFVHTFEKTDARSALVRTYRLAKGMSADRDSDGLPDSIEMAYGTDPSNPDSDDDGLTDGDELYPYYVIDGQFTWEEAAADAAAKGGRIADIKNRDEYLAMVTRFDSRSIGNLWLGASDLAVEGSWVWQDGTPLNNTQWRQPGTPSWASFYNQVGGQSVPWAPGKPDNINNADALSLRSDLLFEDRPILERRGYLIVYSRTTPTNADSDGDGIDDGTEIDNGLDPAVRDPFSGVPTLSANQPGAPFISFSAPGVAGSYQGLVFDPEQGHVYRQTLSLNTKGGFSSSIAGLTSSIRGSFRGSFNPAGYYLGAAPSGIGTVVSIEMELKEDEDSPGNWLILGRATTTTGAVLGIEMRRAKYGKSNRFPIPGRLTAHMPLSSTVQNQGPAGDAVAVGSVNSSGVLAMSMYLPDGGRASFSGSILHGDMVAFRAVSNSRYKSVLLGPLDMADSGSDRDFGGFTRFYASSGPIGSPYPAGFAQLRTVRGSRFVTPTRGFVPASGFQPTQFNSLFNMDGGDFGGISKIGTWSASNKISIPSSPTDRGTASFSTKTGLMTFNYTLTDPERLLTNAKATAYAVSLQKSSQIPGYYSSSFSTGRFTVTPNDGQVPQITMISPLKQEINAAALTYTIDVRTPGAWEISVPTDVDWVTAEITSGGVMVEVPGTTDPVEPADPVDPVDPVDPADPLAPADPADPAVPEEPAPTMEASKVLGNGNGTVRITVAANNTFAIRKAKIQIAGVSHNIKQDYRMSY